jgi:trigger factor
VAATVTDTDGNVIDTAEFFGPPAGEEAVEHAEGDDSAADSAADEAEADVAEAVSAAVADDAK